MRESAERHGVHTQRTGCSRYTSDYYGVFAAAVLGRFYERGMEASVFSNHPPGDAIYRDDLMKSVIDKWTVEVEGRERRFRVGYANTYDEPVGGLLNVLLTYDGPHYRHPDIHDGHALVINIGGFTTGWIAVNPAGKLLLSISNAPSWHGSPFLSLRDPLPGQQRFDWEDSHLLRASLKFYIFLPPQ